MFTRLAVRACESNRAGSAVRSLTGRSMSSSAASPDAAPSAGDESVLINEVNRTGILTLNRPKALNALNLEMVRSIRPILERWQTSKSLVIVKSNVEKAFCAGGDVRSLTTGPPEQAYAFFREEYSVNHLVGTYRVPYVALISGITMGGGVGLSVHGRYRVATAKTMFAMPETLIGLFPDVGGSYFLPRLAGKLGWYLGLTGNRLKGRDVLDAGIATHFCPYDRLADLELALIECSTPDEVEQVLRKHCPVDDAKHRFSLAEHLPKIDEYFGAPTVEQIVERLERDGGEWAQATLKLLQPTSPLSLKVTHSLLGRGAQLSLAECLQMEQRLARRHRDDSDFTEGVRAMLVDRDNAPKWQYSSLADVPAERVEAFFGPLDNPADELILENAACKL